MTGKARRALIDRTAPLNVIRTASIHRTQGAPNELMFRENRCVMHHATEYPDGGRRHM